MTNQEAYEELCDKAEKYDKLVEAIKDIKAEIETTKCDWHDAKLLVKVENLIDKHTKELL